MHLLLKPPHSVYHIYVMLFKTEVLYDIFFFDSLQWMLEIWSWLRHGSDVTAGLDFPSKQPYIHTPTPCASLFGETKLSEWTTTLRKIVRVWKWMSLRSWTCWSVRSAWSGWTPRQRCCRASTRFVAAACLELWGHAENCAARSAAR